jgi:gas vesicle protein
MGKGFILGAFAGSDIVAGLTVLYGPKSGKELGDDLKEKTNQLLTETDSVVGKVKTRTSGVVHDAKEKIVKERSRSKSADKVGVQAFPVECSRAQARGSVGCERAVKDRGWQSPLQ